MTKHQTGVVFVPAYEHTEAGHPESALRTQKIEQLLQKESWANYTKFIEPKPATDEQLLTVHTAEHIALVTSHCANSIPINIDTYVTKETEQQARLAVGGCCQLVDEICTDRVKNGFALVRPPGHHAERNVVDGFCLYNNIAVAARHAQKVHGLGRVAIIDFDVHHGNGTQEIFYEDDSVLFISMHQFSINFYPQVGSRNEMGDATGNGFTLNIPFLPQSADGEYLMAFQHVVTPKLEQFAPDMIFVSAGYDAHWKDPLADQLLSSTGLYQLAKRLVQFATTYCNGKVLFILEGGYNTDVLTEGIHNTLCALSGHKKMRDTLGFRDSSDEIQQYTIYLIQKLRELHGYPPIQEL